MWVKRPAGHCGAQRKAYPVKPRSSNSALTCPRLIDDLHHRQLFLSCLTSFLFYVYASDPERATLHVAQCLDAHGVELVVVEKQSMQALQLDQFLESGAGHSISVQRQGMEFLESPQFAEAYVRDLSAAEKQFLKFGQTRNFS